MKMLSLLPPLTPSYPPSPRPIHVDIIIMVYGDSLIHHREGVGGVLVGRTRNGTLTVL